MAAKLALFRSRKAAAQDDSSLEGLVAPASSQQMLELRGTEPAVAQSTSSVRTTPDLSKIEIRDEIAIGGLGPLELQHRLLSNVFMFDEDRAAYQVALERDQGEPTSTAHAAFGRAGSEFTEVVQLPENRGESFGAEGALLPQGVMAPQGLLARMGLLGSIGLFTPRTDAPIGAGQQAQAKSAAGAQTEPSSAPSFPKLSAENPGAASQQGSAVNTSAVGQSLNPQSQLANHSGPASAIGAAAANEAFQPVTPQSGWFGQALWKTKGSPFLAIFRGIGSLLLALFGFGKPAQAPHRRGTR